MQTHTHTITAWLRCQECQARKRTVEDHEARAREDARVNALAQLLTPVIAIVATLVQVFLFLFW